MTGTGPSTGTGAATDDEIGDGTRSAVEPLPRLAGDVDERLTGVELRRLTARVRAHNLPAQAGQVATDVGEVVISLAIVALYVWGFGAPVREALVSDEARYGLGPGLVQAMALALAFVAGAVLAVRVGPAGLPVAGVRWWVPTVADRTGLVSPSVVRTVLVGIGAGLVAGGVPAAFVGVPLDGILLDTMLGGAVGLVAVAGAGVLQVAGAGSGGLPVRVLTLLLAAVPVVGLCAALWAPEWTAWAAPWFVTAGLAVAGGAGLVLWVTRLDRLRAAELRARASTAMQASAALLTLDSGSMSRTLLSGGPKASRVLPWLPATARGPAGALLAADATLLVRSPGALAGLIALAATGAVLIQVPALAGGIGLWAVVACVGYAGGLAGAVGPRSAGENPRLDALVPLGARVTRVVRTVWPVLTAAVVLVVVAVVGGGGQWLALIAPAAVVLGAAAVRTAYRGPVPWDAPMIATPAGGVPTGLVLHQLKGLDLAVLGTVPLAWAAASGVASPPTIVLQALFAVGAVLWAAHVKRTA